jgi:gamma-glutamyltranspeptidase
MKGAQVATNQPAVEAGLSVLNAGGDFADALIAYEGDWLGV